MALAAFAAKAIPPSPATYVHNEGVVSESTAQQLSSILRGLERTTGRQFVVALFKSLEDDALEPYANRLFKAWAIGSKKNDDGLLFAMFLEERRWRVEIGYGLEGTLTDLEAADLVETNAVPFFKAGDYDTGILNAARALAAKIGGPEAGVEAPVAPPLPPARDYSDVIRVVATAIGAFFFVFWGTFEAGFNWPGIPFSIGSPDFVRQKAYPIRLPFIVWLYFLLLLRILLELGSGRGGGSRSSGGGGFSGGGGSSGGGGASGSW